MLQKDQLFPWRTVEKNLFLPLEIKKMKNEEIIVEDVCASFQEAVVEVLSQKAIKAAKEKGIKVYSEDTFIKEVVENDSIKELM